MVKIIRGTGAVAVRRKRRRLAIGLAVFGLLVAAAFFAYFETDPPLGNPTVLWVAEIALFLCPGSLLFVTSIDIEPQTTGFAIMWLLIGLMNLAVYGAIGVVVGRFRWSR